MAGEEIDCNLVDRAIRKAAVDRGVQILVDDAGNYKLAVTPTGEVTPKGTKATKTNKPVKVEVTATIENVQDNEVMNFIHNANSFKPADVILPELKWKFLVRSVLRGKNIMMTGPAGSGKTMIAQRLADVTKRPFFYFNLGSTQDPRATLIGNTHYSKDNGTFFAESLFIQAIQTENSIILCDELTRSHPEAWNILMTVFDPGQRYLRIDEHVDSPTIKVAPGVCFLATANIGSEYTSTRTMDRALMDRFVILEMEHLSAVEESVLLKIKFPNLSNAAINQITEVTSMTRIDQKSETPRLSTAVSTRVAVEIAELMLDGFNLIEAAEVAIIPHYSEAGGAESERTYVRQFLQKFATVVSDNGAADIIDATVAVVDTNVPF